MDFESFTLQGTGNTEELNGGVCLDSFTVSVCICLELFLYVFLTIVIFQSNTGQQIPTICGQNTGQHSKYSIGLNIEYILMVFWNTVYVDMGAQASDTATLNFAFSGTASTRAWEVKATQIPCASRSA